MGKTVKELYLTKGILVDEMINLTFYDDGTIEVCAFDKYTKTIMSCPFLSTNGRGQDLCYGAEAARQKIAFTSHIDGKLLPRWKKIK